MEHIAISALARTVRELTTVIDDQQGIEILLDAARRLDDRAAQLQVAESRQEL